MIWDRNGEFKENDGGVWQAYIPEISPASEPTLYQIRIRRYLYSKIKNGNESISPQPADRRRIWTPADPYSAMSDFQEKLDLPPGILYGFPV